MKLFHNLFSFFFFSHFYLFSSCPFTFPQSPKLIEELYSIDDRGINTTNIILLDSFSGSISKTKSSQIYRISNTSYDLWLSYIKSLTNIKVNENFVNDFSGLIDHLLTSNIDEIKGMAIYSDINDNDNSLTHAITYCAGSNGVIAVSSDSASYYSNTYNLPILFDARVETLPDSLNLSNNIITFQQGSAQSFMIDYAIFSSSPFISWDDNMLREKYLSHLTKYSSGCSASFGWVGDEGTYVSTLSRHGIWAHASDWAKNLATLTNIQIPISSPQQKQKQQKYHQKENILQENKSNIHSVTFVMTDGDNLQWLLDSFVSSNQPWYGSSSRPETTLTFTIPSSLYNLSSVVLSHIYNESTINNSFIISVSGIGYIYPELLHNDDVFAQYVEQTLNSIKLLPSLRILNILAGDDNISDERLLNSCEKFLESDQIDGVFYYTYGSGYAGGGGKSIWSSNNKPIITPRYSLWGDNNDPTVSPMLSTEGIITALKEQIQDITSSSGYSVIPVHAWTHTVDDVNYIINNLNDENIQVLTSDQFLERYRENVKH